MSRSTNPMNNYHTKTNSSLNPCYNQGVKKCGHNTVKLAVATVTKKATKALINTPSCSRINFTTIDNDGNDGKQSRSCFWISISQLMRLTKLTTDPKMPGPSPIQLRQTMRFPQGSIMFDITSSSYLRETEGHAVILQQLCDRYNLAISIYYVNYSGAYQSCWIGQPAITFIDSKRPVPASHHFSLANFEAHFEPIVSQTPTSREINPSYLKEFTLKNFKYISEDMTDMTNMTDCYSAESIKVHESTAKPPVPSSVHRAQLSNVTVKRDAIIAYISSCKIELENLLLASRSDAFPGLPQEMLILHQQKTQAQISTIESTLDASRELLEVYNLQITELE